VDNIEVVHHRLHREHEIDATLKDCMVWREEEILATELMSQGDPRQQFYILRPGPPPDDHPHALPPRLPPQACARSTPFPMSHVVDMPDVLAEIDALPRRSPSTSSPSTPATSTRSSSSTAPSPPQRGQGVHRRRAPHLRREQGPPTAKPIRVRVREILDIAGDIDGQIYMRDFKLIDQSDMIVSYIPELPGGIPGLSSGVERELHHAFEHTKEVFVVWKPKKAPSPFITETATRIFRVRGGSPHVLRGERLLRREEPLRNRSTSSGLGPSSSSGMP
jgi:adenylate kinase